MKLLKCSFFSVLVVVNVAVAASEPQLLRPTYHSEALNAERGYLLYLPPGHGERDHWPVILFLHGNGERGDGKGELDYVLKHGPLFEAWCQRRDLPFIIISPQMPMQDQGEVSYIKNRKPEDIPRRLASGRHPYPSHYSGKDPMQGQLSEDFSKVQGNAIPARRGWSLLADEVVGILDDVISKYGGDPRRVYLTGISMGGFGTWTLASEHPDRFAAIAPIAGFGMPDMAPALAKVPLWAFAGGRDTTVRLAYFYPALNALEKAGHRDVRFTIEADMGHDVWRRVYAGQDLYDWFLSHSN
ncbi:MAG: prolyl oligopeptidase family serine peptidase [Opitutaceae bacterium]|nr:prolyl oligopeptidase family serine peptidase [Opitutaceae bacterium]